MLDILVVMFLFILLALILNNYYYLKLKQEIHILKEEKDGTNKDNEKIK